MITTAEYLSKNYTAPQLRKILSEDFGMVGISKDRKGELVLSLAVLLDAAHEEAEYIMTESEAMWAEEEKMFADAQQKASEKAEKTRRQKAFIGFDQRISVYHEQNGGKVLTATQQRRAAKKFKTQLKRTGDLTLAMKGRM